MAASMKFWARIALPLWWVGMTAGSHWPRLDLAGIVGMRNDDFAFGLDKWLHVCAYIGLAVLSLTAFRKSRVGLTLLALLLWAAVDELTQSFVPGREMWWSDFCASSIGIGLGSILWGVTVWLNDHDHSFVAHTRIVAALTLVSRFFGLARDWALAFAFGFGGVLDAFSIAFMAPNLFRRLFGEGALAAALIPRYTRLNRSDPATASVFARRVIRTVFTWLMGLSGVAMAVLLLVAVLAPLNERWDLVVKLTAITIWYAPLVCAAALLGAVLQVHGRFGPPAASPVILNVLMIAAALVATRMGSAGIYLVVGAVVVAGIAQVVWHAVLMPRRTGGPSPVDEGAISDARRALLTQFIPTVIGLGVFQLNVLADSMIAMLFSGAEGSTFSLFGHEAAYPMGVGSVGVLGSAARLYEFPLGVFGIAVATAIYPALSAAASDPSRFSDILHRGLRLTMFIGLPASVGLILVREPLCLAIYGEGGALKEGDADRVAWVLLGYAPAIWAYSMNHILTRAFYAHGDTLTPMRIGLAMVAVNVALNLTLIWPLGVAGLAWSTATCAILQTGVLLWLVRRYVPVPVGKDVWGAWLKVVAITAVMAGAVAAALSIFDPHALSRVRVIGLLLGASGLGALVVLAGAAALKMPELRWLARGRD